MSSYLCGRRQRVKLDNVYSDWRVVKTGVPQGSLLGPLLFNIYINDLNYKVSNTSLRLYPDDTTEYAFLMPPQWSWSIRLTKILKLYPVGLKAII